MLTLEISGAKHSFGTLELSGYLLLCLRGYLFSLKPTHLLYLLPFFLIKQGKMSKREISVCQQTWALLCKNFLKKWRMKRESLMV